MDFGTIAHNLEHGLKYMNSEDVFKDVQYIWDNCFKYNNKGDYIVDLMKRVKKNFTKYWLASGLYSDTAGIGHFFLATIFSFFDFSSWIVEVTDNCISRLS